MEISRIRVDTYYPDLRGNYWDPRGNCPDLRGNYPDLRGNYPDPRGNYSLLANTVSRANIDAVNVFVSSFPIPDPCHTRVSIMTRMVLREKST